MTDTLSINPVDLLVLIFCTVLLDVSFYRLHRIYLMCIYPNRKRPCPTPPGLVVDRCLGAMIMCGCRRSSEDQPPRQAEGRADPITGRLQHSYGRPPSTSNLQSSNLGRGDCLISDAVVSSYIRTPLRVNGESHLTRILTTAPTLKRHDI